MCCKRDYRRIVCAVGLLLCVSARLEAGNGTDYRQMRNEIQIFENILRTAIKNEFNHPLALVNEPRGSYLPGYGVNFSFLLNVNRDEVNTPFGVKRFSATPRPRAEKIRVVRELILKLLGEYGNALTQLSGDENFTVSAHIEDRTSLVPQEREEVMVFRVSKRALAEYSSRKIDLKHFRERVETIEY
ncbi:MAG: hypothetical protein HYX74_07190 [Acidobacteria bacterium]|nr:hypothetical protein [Acidobacteriota bacterium]